MTADSSAEYKQVTVLFADVVHSMDIAAAVGAERLREIMGEVFHRSSVIVQRYGGTVDKFTGDGIMAVFGAPVALEDHAVRACRAALDIQTDAQHLAAEVEARDHITLQLRIGLNSGEVITGEIGSGPLAYTAVGEQVGMAQRMESVAPPGGVMVSESTARLVDTTAMLGETEQVHIKGAAGPVPARRLLGMATDRQVKRVETTFVGREWELGALKGMLDRTTKGSGSVVGVVGPPGIGKSRIVREVTSLAAASGVDVGVTNCESHTVDVPFHAAAGLLRSSAGLNGLDDAAARKQVQARFSDADAEDLLLVHDLLGIGDPEAELPQIDPDARRRRLSATVKTAVLARPTPIVYVIEDAHWIDEISESMLAELLEVAPRTRSFVLVTYRPEYSGALAHAPRSQTIALEPLDDSQMRELSTELLGRDGSITELANLITDRAAGNPFFAEEIVRDLSERDVLVGGRGCYLCADPIADVHVPSTLQAVIAARIDRLGPAAKRTLNAAAVIGSRFNPGVLEALGVELNVDELVRAELIDQTGFSPQAEYVFRHPLIRTVAYESQLKSDRAQLHMRVAAAVDQNDQNAALIAEHMEAAGDLHGAYGWHMRAGAWSLNRDTLAAQLSWERARQSADRLTADDPDRTAMRIAPRTAICVNAWRRFHPDLSERFRELRDLCAEAGDKPSLATAMAGMTVEYVLHGEVAAASQLASEYMALVESMNDSDLTVGLAFAAIIAKLQTTELDDVLRWTQTMIDLAEGDPTKGAFIMGSPLSVAYVWRGLGRWGAGLDGWREDLERASSLARDADPLSYAAVLSYKYGPGIMNGVVSVDESTLEEIAGALRAVERSSDDMAIVLLRMALAIAMIHQQGEHRKHGLDTLRELQSTCVNEGFALNVVPAFDTYLARAEAHDGRLDRAMPRLRALLDEAFNTGNWVNLWPTANALVESLLIRSSDADLEEADAVIGRVSALHLGCRLAPRDIFVLRLRALVARGRGNDSAYCNFRDRYRAMANDLGFEGHMKWAAEMP